MDAGKKTNIYFCDYPDLKHHKSELEDTVQQTATLALTLHWRGHVRVGFYGCATHAEKDLIWRESKEPLGPPRPSKT